MKKIKLKIPLVIEYENLNNNIENIYTNNYNLSIQNIEQENLNNNENNNNNNEFVKINNSNQQAELF